MNNASITVGIVGATGAVGQELLALLHDRNFPLASLRLFASARSVGKVVEYAGKKYTVEEAKLGAFAGVDVAFFAVGGSVTRALAPDATLIKFCPAESTRIKATPDASPGMTFK